MSHGAVFLLIAGFRAVAALPIYREDIPNAVNIVGVSALGHENKAKGGGKLSQFGMDFKKNGYAWTKEFCMTDSDEDGFTNGEELGDPCCVWQPGQTPSRRWKLSNPSHRYEAVSEAYNCSATHQPQSDSAQEQAEFWDFYYAYKDGEKQGEQTPVEAKLAELSRLPYSCDPEWCSVNEKCCTAANHANPASCAACAEECRASKSLNNDHRVSIRVSMSCYRKPRTIVNGTMCAVCKDRDQMQQLTCCNLHLLRRTKAYDNCPKCDIMLQNLDGELSYEMTGGGNLCAATHVTAEMLAQGAGPLAAIKEQTRPNWSQFFFKRILGRRASKNMLASWLVLFVFLSGAGMLYWDRHLLRACVKRGQARSACLFILAAVLYIDVMSGALHLTLDNPHINHWPVLGQAAKDFQGHHKVPNDITRAPWIGHLTEMFFVNAGMHAIALIFRDGRLRLSMLFMDGLCMLMMASHRWAHTHPRDTPTAVLMAQSCGLLISNRHHSYHHSSYDNNFAIFTGWSNPVYNALVKLPLLGVYSKIWPVILLLFAVAPFIVVSLPRSGARSKTCANSAKFVNCMRLSEAVKAGGAVNALNALCRRANLLNLLFARYARSNNKAKDTNV